MQETFEFWQHRSQVLFGAEAMQKLQRSHILLAGAGGVGGYVAEALTRAGVGSLTVYDPDTVHPSNLNRQLLALHSTDNLHKTAVLAQRLPDINPQISLDLQPIALTAGNIPHILQSNHFDYVIDAIDSLHDKCFLLAAACRQNIPVISSMGAGCRWDPTQVQYADISKTFGCPLAKAVRSKLKKEYDIRQGIECVFSPESNPHTLHPSPNGERPIIGSSSFMPGIFGLFIAARVINRLREASND